LAPGRFTTE